MARAPHPLVLAAIAVAGIALCAFSIHVATNEGVPDIQVALLQWISIPYIAAGLIAWWRRPESRLGVLMVCVGFSTGVLCLQFVENTVLWSIGASVDIFAAAAFIHVTLAFPTGRLRSTRERWVVGGGYAIALGLQVAKLLFLGALPQNGFAVTDDFDTYRTIERVQLYSTSAICLAALAILVGRWTAAGGPRRLWPSVLTVVFAAGLVGLATLYVFAAAEWPAFVEVQRTALGIIGFTPVLFLIGVLDARLARSGVGDLVVQLRGNPDAAQLEAALARALRDPTLKLVYWLPEFGSYADAEGHEVALPGPDEGRAMTPIQHDSVRVAALLHDPWLTEERELMDAVTAVAGIALENARLQVELRARLEELRGSRARIVEVAQDERKRLERNLHDGAQQRLVALSMELGRIESRLAQDAPERAELERARGEIATSLRELRQVARGLHPAVVSSHGLEVALEQLTATAPVPVALTVRVDHRLPEAIEVAAFYIVSESLANIGKHARAEAVRVEVLRQDGLVRVEVADDGVGGADTERGSGLRGLADRVEALGGRLRVWSPAGAGTRVSAEIPCGS
jgi:signal transduction histidine kinase